MLVKDILAEKGTEVFTMGPDSTIAEAVDMLASHRIGAIVITRGDGRIAGILSERDIVRQLSKEGVAVLDKPLSSAMTSRVSVCHEGNSVNDVMEVMTAGRFRHLPVEKDGRLAGIVSIGDVVKGRIAEVESEAEEIRNYIATA